MCITLYMYMCRSDPGLGVKGGCVKVVRKNTSAQREPIQGKSSYFFFCTGKRKSLHSRVSFFGRGAAQVAKAVPGLRVAQHLFGEF